MPSSTRARLPVADDPATCCAPMTAGVLDVADAEELAHRFKALGDPTRVRLVSLIAAAPGAEACICDLTEPVGLSQPTVSHHMKILADAGLVRREQRGRWAYFTVQREALDALARTLGEPATAAPRRSGGGLTT
ncbi:ArsR family transcriptional regulator [Phycicoccus sp. Root563]|uniref:ArsR/SmtB family transcription factor n=1 Tax=unclassified Phycicoccus TaxID=2637926 RepID=UPI000702CD40|nr:ArsR family transcriptional regulator [Phycicoccus sp. Root101]KQZ90284.1 ArsR family transcriptional regulator [Phycicoccus sp. Root563]